MIYEIFNLFIGVSVMAGTIILLMGDSDNHPLQEKNMDILIPAAIITAVVLASIRKFKPELWVQIKSKFKK